MLREVSVSQEEIEPEAIEEVEEDSSPHPQWHIDMASFAENGRSFRTLAESCLCKTCYQRLTGSRKKITDADLITAITGCCSRSTGYINPRMPLLESIFRLFLANGNQPLEVEDLAKQLAEWRGIDIYYTSTGVLPRLLGSDRYYGIKMADQEE